MANSSILIPGQSESIDTPSTIQQDKYLQIDNYLSEYSSSGQQEVVRENLGVPSKESVFTIEETIAKIDEKIVYALSQLLQQEDPYNILPEVNTLIQLMTKTDGSTPFTSPQKGIDPIENRDLTTKQYVDTKLQNHLSSNDPHNIIDKVQNILVDYIKASQVYLKQEVYNQEEVIQLLKSYIQNNGDTPFINPQVGVDPQVDSHLATKRYIDNVLYQHQVSQDPHNLVTYINDLLSKYSKNSDVFNKNETYSRNEINSIIGSLVQQETSKKVNEYTKEFNDEINKIYSQNYIKKDGTIKFSNPQKGVDAIEVDEFITLKQLNDVKTELSKQITSNVWVTSGPVKASVGLVQEGTTLPETLSIQDAFDTIFYGESIEIICPQYTTIGQKCTIKLIVRGPIDNINAIEIYQSGTLISTLNKESFQDKIAYIDSNVILQDTEFTIKVKYHNIEDKTYKVTTKIMIPVFVGLLPKWKTASTITMEYLKELQQEDVNGTMNRFIDKANNTDSINFNYSFDDEELKHIFIVLPKEYPDLVSINTSAQTFYLGAFDVINMIPLQVDNVEDSVIFKIYVYKQTLSNLHSKITFNFE